MAKTKANNNLTVSELAEAREQGDIEVLPLAEVVQTLAEVDEKAYKEAAQDAAKPKVIIDRGGGQIHVAGKEGVYLRLIVNGKTVDSQKVINGMATLRFPGGWPSGDFTYKIEG